MNSHHAEDLNDSDDLVEYAPYSPETLSKLQPGQPELYELNGEEIEIANVSDEVPTTSGRVASQPNVEQPASHVPRYICAACNEVTHTSADFIRHVLQHSTVNGGHSLLTYRDITPEEIQALVNVQEKFVCSMCGEFFEAMGEVKMHMINVHRCLEARPTGIPSPDVKGCCENGQIHEERPVSVSPGAKVETTDTPPKAQEKSDELISEFLKPMALRAFKEKLLAGKKLKCPRKGCAHKFENAAQRELHLKCHTDGTHGPSELGGNEKRHSFKCYECSQAFDRWMNCAAHMWKEHKIDVNMFKCPLCDRRFIFAVKVFRHLQSHRPVKQFACSVCGKLLATQKDRAMHEDMHKKKQQQQQLLKKQNRHVGLEDDSKDADTEEQVEEGGEANGDKQELRWYSKRKCNICGHMFSTSKILSKHIKTVHHKIKAFICNICGYKAARKLTLTIHMRQHTGQKPLACQSCPFRTADPSALKYHEKRHREERSYACRICGFLAIQAISLKEHTRNAHPKEYEAMRCDLCKFTSVNPELLHRHRMDHKGGLIKSEDSRDSIVSKRSKNAPESSSDCFLPLESTDSVVHDTGGFTIPAVINAPVAHSEDTQFPT